MLSPIAVLTNGTYSLAKTDRLSRCDTSDGNIILDLPPVVSHQDLNFFVKKISDDGNSITVNAPSGKTIDGEASFNVSSFNQSVWIMSLDDGNYELVSTYSPDFSVAPIGSVAVKSLASDQTAPGSLDVVPTMPSITFTIGEDGDVEIAASAFFEAGGAFFGGFVGVRLDGTDYTLGKSASNNGSGGDVNYSMNAYGFRSVHLAAGTYTAELLASNAGSACTIKAGASFRITIQGTGGAISVSGMEVQLNESVESSGNRDLDFVDSDTIEWTVTADGANNRTKIEGAVVGGGGADLAEVLFLKSYFDDQGLLPSTTIKEMLKSFDTFDGVSGSGAFSYLSSRAKETANAETYARFNLGASYTKILLIVGLLKQASTNYGLWIANTLSSSVPTDGNMFMNETNSARFAHYKLNGFSNSTTDATEVTGTGTFSTVFPMMAMHLDLAAGTRRFRAYLRWAGEMWWPIFDISDNTAIAITAAQYAGIYMHNGPGWAACPFGLWAQ